MRTRMNIESPTRAYRQSARASGVVKRGELILDAFANRMRGCWFDEIRLEDVARDAGVTVQTVIRRFGGKDGLIAAMQDRVEAEVSQRRNVAAGDVTRAVDSIVEDYETVGDLILRLLAQEDRYEPVGKMTALGRKQHREWIAKAFAPWLASLDADAQRCTTDALVVAADLYVWKLVRRDMRRPVAEYRQMLENMLASAIGVTASELFDTSILGVS